MRDSRRPWGDRPSSCVIPIYASPVHPSERRGAAEPGRSAIAEHPMDLDTQLTYFEYSIKIIPEGPRFKAHVSRGGGLIEHEGRASEIWASPSCASIERAIWVAKNAIDT